MASLFWLYRHTVICLDPSFEDSALSLQKICDGRPIDDAKVVSDDEVSYAGLPYAMKDETRNLQRISLFLCKFC